MPRGDGTGPQGSGPKTGRGAGYCAGYPVPGYMNPMPGGGWGWGRGRGRRHRWRGGWGPAWFGPGYPYGPELTPKQEAEMLKEQAQVMQEGIKAINERIGELESIVKKSK